MKNLVVMLILAFAGTSLYPAASEEPIQNNPKVIAFSGLKLRAEPNKSGKVLKVIPFAQSVEILDTLDNVQSVEWLTGRWVKIKYEGRTGYVFDAFLTPLPIPVNDYELSQNDADISYPLLSWAEHNLKVVAGNDTIRHNNHVKLVQYFEDSIVVTRKEGSYAFEVTVDIPNIRLGDAYNLARSLLLSQKERTLFEENTLYVSNDEGVVDRISIDIDAPVDIIKRSDGVLIKVRSYQYVCSL